MWVRPLTAILTDLEMSNTADNLRASGARRRASTRSAPLRVPWGRSEDARQLHPLVGQRFRAASRRARPALSALGP
jgi:hypothetical protein